MLEWQEANHITGFMLATCIELCYSISFYPFIKTIYLPTVGNYPVLLYFYFHLTKLQQVISNFGFNEHLQLIEKSDKAHAKGNGFCSNIMLEDDLTTASVSHLPPPCWPLPRFRMSVWLEFTQANILIFAGTLTCKLAEC